MKFKTIDDHIAFVLSYNFCKKIIESKEINNACEGDCIACRTQYLTILFSEPLIRLKGLLVPCDNNIRYKLPKNVTDSIITESLSGNYNIALKWKE